ncbi:MAG: hypothetical protein P8L72_03155 [Flavobacteriaceae bacterium]|nr:hypothetical protein [Flavobacteriaceae bacterium]MDG2314366.1 hypothetical protein [Flavobacteriaceae bacterium]
MKNHFLSLLIALVLTTSCEETTLISEVKFNGELMEIMTYGGSQEDIGFDIIETQDGGLAVIGNSKSSNGTLTDKTLEVSDYWLLRFDAQMELLWSYTYGGSDDDRGQSVIETSDGGFILAGYSKSADGNATKNQGQHDNWMLKVDASGNFLWEKSFGYAGHDHAYTIISTQDGGFLMTGFIDVTASGGKGNKAKGASFHGVGEFWTHKFDAIGNMQWRRYHGGTNNDRSYDAVEANDGGFIITGATESNDVDVTSNQGEYDVWVIKLNAEGTLQWAKTFGGSGIDSSNGILKTPNGNYLIVGNTFSKNGSVSINYGASDVWVLCIDDQGDLLWEKTYGGSEFDLGRGITQGPNNTAFVVGNSKSRDNYVLKNQGENDVWVFQIDTTNGKLLWEQSFGGSAIDFGHNAVFTSSKSLYVVGETTSSDGNIPSNKGDKDLLIAHFQ